MSYDKNATPKYYCTTSTGSTFLAVSIPSVKRQASKYFDGSHSALQSVFIHDYESGDLVSTLRRVNRHDSDGKVIHGKWN